MVLPRQEPPHSLEAEQAVLGAMFLGREAVVKVVNILDPEDFYRETHKLIFAAMRELLEQELNVDSINLIEKLKQKQQLEAVGGLGYLLSLEKSQFTTSGLEQHANIVKNASLKRQLNQYGRMVAAAANTGEEASIQLEEAYKGLNTLLENKKTTDFSAVGSLLEEYIDYIAAKDAEHKGYTGFATSFQGLDELTNGLQRSDFIILAARPSMGKTAMALNLVKNILLDNEESYNVAIFSMEMHRRQLVNRLVAMLTSIDSFRLEQNQLDELEWELMWRVQRLLSGKKLYIDDTGGLSLPSLANRARRLKLEQGLDIIVIDYIQLMACSGKYVERQQAVAEISRSLKALARELDVTIIALSQLSRAAESRQNKTPILSDLRESGSLEQDADMVMFLYREDYYDSHCEGPGVTELIVAKNRNGPIGSFKFYFEKQQMVLCQDLVQIKMRDLRDLIPFMSLS